MEENKNNSCNTSFCDGKNKKCQANCDRCYTNMEAYIQTRRCFMTGEYCSKQPNIQKERKKLHDAQKIKAFVIMNFSDMSDVVYKWRMRSFIETLSKYLRFSADKEKIYCNVTENGNRLDNEIEVENIEVVRSDSDPASNYIVCSRICQQMQIADLVIVDVSSQNANVFYEFGMAVAFGKLILPICYSESFYKRAIPKKLKKTYWDEKEENKNLEHHIGFYPWRKELFEYYGIRYKTGKNSLKDEKGKSKTQYLSFDEAIKVKYGFSDIKYDRFPYHESLRDGEDKIGKQIYKMLKDDYNNADSNDNTLVVYTMDAFLNEEEAGRCIVNFYRNITSRMNWEKCFCGERVGVLVQDNVIPESEKDAREKLDIDYSIGEIIQIGTNQATYLAAEEKIKSNDNILDLLGYSQNEAGKPGVSQQEEMERFVKGHIKNRAMRIYPNDPVFVDRMKNLLHKDLLSIEKIQEKQEYGCSNLKAFCLYHVMVRTLRYTNEIVVDISNNCLQSLFWLGAAHGSDIYAITVMYEKTDKEKLRSIHKTGKENRHVFDVAGLWMAILQKHDTEGFYKQLAAAQSGIERHSKLMLLNSESYKKKMQEHLFSLDMASDNKENTPDALIEEKNKEEAEILESYYRNCFWGPMLSYNQLSIYLSQINEKGKEGEPRLCMSKWDFNAVSVLSQYLSRKKVIGKYSLVSLSEDDRKNEAERLNFICVGSESRPLEERLSDRISNKIAEGGSKYKNREGFNTVHMCEKIRPRERLEENPKGNECNKRHLKSIKGFKCIGNDEIGLFAHQPQTQICAKCDKIKNSLSPQSEETEIFFSRSAADEALCCLNRKGNHCEIAQLILWRKDAASIHERDYFRVGIIGCSGPATFALSALFVTNEEIKIEEGFKKEENLLSELQRIARERFMEIFLERLGKGLEECKVDFCKESGEKSYEGDEKEKEKEDRREQQKKYYNLVKYAVVSYLSTVLYRYFFPFLSGKEINRIYNGMYTFVNSMKAARVSPFALNYRSSKTRQYDSFVCNDSVEKVVKCIPEALLETLKSFKGLEAFYEVTVEHSLSDPDIKEDTRKVIGIKLVEKEETPIGEVSKDTKVKDEKQVNQKPYVNCFFIDEPKDEKNLSEIGV